MVVDLRVVSRRLNGGRSGKQELEGNLKMIAQALGPVAAAAL